MLLQVLTPVGMFILIANCWNCSVIIRTVKASLHFKWTAIVCECYCCIRLCTNNIGSDVDSILLDMSNHNNRVELDDKCRTDVNCRIPLAPKPATVVSIPKQEVAAYPLLAFIDKFGFLTNQWTWLYEFFRMKFYRSNIYRIYRICRTRFLIFFLDY